MSEEQRKQNIKEVFFVMFCIILSLMTDQSDFSKEF